MKSLSRRIPKDFTPGDLSALLEKKRQSGGVRVDLTVSNPTEAGLRAEEGELARCVSGADPVRYSPDPRGLRSAREAICAEYAPQGIRIDSDRLWLTSGTSEAYSFLFRLLADPGDSFLVPTPSYPLFGHLLELDGLRAKPFRLLPDGAWKLDFDSMECAADASTKGIVVVHPNNPTGSYLSPEEMKGLVRFCARKNLALIADEVFLTYPLAGDRRPSFLEMDAEIPIFVLDGLSKRCGLPQMKISWIHVAAPPAAHANLAAGLDWISDAYLSVSGPAQYALPGLFGIGRRLHGEILSRIRENRGFLASVKGAPEGFRDVTGDGGWSAVVRLPDGVDEERLALDLLEKRGVAVHPGYLFDLPFDSSCVLSLLPRPEDFQNGVGAVVDALRGSAISRSS